MKRHPSLQPLSREHHRALLCWRDLDVALSRPENGQLQQAVSRLQTYWRERFASHMSQEEAVLAPQLDREHGLLLLEQHEALRSLHASTQLAANINPLGHLVDLRALATYLRQHIRWEERVLFPYLESRLSEVQLSKLAQELVEFESAEA